MNSRKIIHVVSNEYTLNLSIKILLKIIAEGFLKLLRRRPFFSGTIYLFHDLLWNHVRWDIWSSNNLNLVRLTNNWKNNWPSKELILKVVHIHAHHSIEFWQSPIQSHLSSLSDPAAGKYLNGRRALRAFRFHNWTNCKYCIETN